MNTFASLIWLSVALVSPCASSAFAAEPIKHSIFATGGETRIVAGDRKTIWKYPAATRDGYVLPNGNLLLALSKNQDYPAARSWR